MWDREVFDGDRVEPLDQAARDAVAGVAAAAALARRRRRVADPFARPAAAPRHRAMARCARRCSSSPRARGAIFSPVLSVRRLRTPRSTLRFSRFPRRFCGRAYTRSTVQPRLRRVIRWHSAALLGEHCCGSHADSAQAVECAGRLFPVVPHVVLPTLFVFGSRSGCRLRKRGGTGLAAFWRHRWKNAL